VTQFVLFSLSRLRLCFEELTTRSESNTYDMTVRPFQSQTGPPTTENCRGILEGGVNWNC